MEKVNLCQAYLMLVGFIYETKASDEVKTIVRTAVAELYKAAKENSEKE